MEKIANNGAIVEVDPEKLKNALYSAFTGAFLNKAESGVYVFADGAVEIDPPEDRTPDTMHVHTFAPIPFDPFDEAGYCDNDLAWEIIEDLQGEEKQEYERRFEENLDTEDESFKAFIFGTDAYKRLCTKLLLKFKKKTDAIAVNFLEEKSPRWVVLYFVEDDIVRIRVYSALKEACDAALAFDCPEFERDCDEDEDGWHPSHFIGVYDLEETCCYFWVNNERRRGSDYYGNDETINAVISEYLRH